MEKIAPQLRIEPRWPLALTILVVLILLTMLPDRVRFLPVWVPYLPGMTILVSMAAVPLTGAKVRWLRIERIIMLLFCVAIGVWTLVSLAYLIAVMVNRSRELDGLQLLTSSIAVWVTNVLMFSLLYWRIDRGGPEVRLNNSSTKPDWLFPQAEMPEVLPDWRPTFVDYLFLAFTTATAFSPTDTLPLTSRAKLS